LVLEGLTYRIAEHPVTSDSGFGFSGRTWVNEPAVRRRLDHDYVYRGLYDERGSWRESPYKDENATRMARNYPAARLELAYALHRQGRIAEGIDQLERIERMDPGFTGADGLLGLYYMDAGDTARSLAYFQDRERREPSSDLFYYYGVCLGALGRTDEAVAKLERAGTLDPADSEPWRTAAGLLEKAGRKEEAERMRRIAEGKAGSGGSS
jgi:tetratricopeptide (TPR) repeat protein